MIKLKNIRQHMESAGIRTQKDLALAMGVSIAHTNRVFNEKTPPGIKIVDRLCTTLKCKPGDILEHYPK